MKMYKLAVAALLMGVSFYNQAKRAASYTPRLQEVLTPIEYISIYPSFNKRTGGYTQLQDAKRKLEALLKRTKDSYKRKGIEREISELHHIIRQAD